MIEQFIEVSAGGYRHNYLWRPPDRIKFCTKGERVFVFFAED